MNQKVLCISNHGEMLGGGEYSFLDFLRNLPDPWKPVVAVPSDGMLNTLLHSSAIETHIIELPSIRPWAIKKIVSSIRQLITMCRKIQPRIIYANGSRAAFYAGISKLFHRTPIIWHCRIANKDPLLDLLLEMFCNIIIVNSQATARRFGQNSGNKVRQIFNGIDLQWMKSQNGSKPELIKDNWKVILMAARISKEKRHDIAIDAFETIAANDLNLHLIFIGAKDVLEQEWTDFLQEKTSKSKFSSRIHWVGPVEDTRPWYRAAFLTILPSINESFGRVLVESMACGVPVVASRSGGIPEVIRHGKDGLLAAPGDAAEFIQAMTKIISNPSLRDQLGRSALSRAKLFRLETHISKMVDIFETVLS